MAVLAVNMTQTELNEISRENLVVLINDTISSLAIPILNRRMGDEARLSIENAITRQHIENTNRGNDFDINLLRFDVTQFGMNELMETITE